MRNVMDLSRVVSEFADECQGDYVGLWQLARALPDGATSTERATLIVSLVTALLHAGPIRLGQFQDDEFHPWSGTESEQLERLQRELEVLGRDPDIGEIAWMTAM